MSSVKKLFVIGGMGAGKSIVSRTLAAQGCRLIDLDYIGHEVLSWDTVRNELQEIFGDDIISAEGTVKRRVLAAKAFATPASTRKLSHITMPRIEEVYADHIARLEREGASVVVVEYSAFKNREMSLAYSADSVIAVLADVEKRVERAVAAGWDEDDVRLRIARQITDEERAEMADVVFYNNGTLDELKAAVISWWNTFKMELA